MSQGLNSECCSSCVHSQEEELLELAHEAWREVLKDKIKDELLKHSGSHLNELAKLVTKTKREKVKNSITLHDFKNQILDLVRKDEFRK